MQSVVQLCGLDSRDVDDKTIKALTEFTAFQIKSALRREIALTSKNLLCLSA